MMKPMKPLTSLIMVIMAILLLTAVPIAASDREGRGQGADDQAADQAADQADEREDERETGRALGRIGGRIDVNGGIKSGVDLGLENRAAARADARARGGVVASGVVASIDARRDLERANRPFEMPSGILNAQCVQKCVELTLWVTSYVPETEEERAEQKQGIERQCIEKCRAENQERHEAKKAFRANFSEAIRGLNEQQKAVRDEFKELKRTLKNETPLTDEETDEETAQLREAQAAAREKIDVLRDQKQELIESLPESFKTPHIIARGELVKLNRALERSRENYALARQMHLESRKSIEERKQQYHECLKKGETASETNTVGDEAQDEARQRCKETRRQFAGDVKVFLVKTADVVVENLNKLKYHVKLSEDITNKEAEKLLADIEQRIIDVKNARAIVEELKEDASKDELAAAAKTIHDAWQETRVLFKKDVGVLMQAKLGNILHRMGQLTMKFERARDRLKEKGADVTVLDEQLADLDAMLADARANYEAAVKVFAEAHTAKNVDEATKQAHELVKKARADLKEAQQLLRKVTAEIKAQLRAAADVEVNASAADTTDTSVTAEAATTATAEGEVAATTS